MWNGRADEMDDEWDSQTDTMRKYCGRTKLFSTRFFSLDYAEQQERYYATYDGGCFGRMVGVKHSDRLLLKQFSESMERGNLIGRVAMPTMRSRHDGFDGEHYAPSNIKIVSMEQARPVLDRSLRMWHHPNNLEPAKEGMKALPTQSMMDLVEEEGEPDINSEEHCLFCEWTHDFEISYTMESYDGLRNNYRILQRLKSESVEADTGTKGW
ncbi:MAG: hypothetical protein SGARI_005808 [Bacillariaceae sp.]